MDNNKNKVLSLIGLIIILITVLGLTYAFFAPQAGGTTSTNATVTSNTTDLLTFSINQDISFTVTQADFQENGTNKSGEATATATLTPNNKTGAATMNYYLYLSLSSNPITYSVANTNELPELMLQVFNNNNELVTLTGLGTQQTIKGVTGYDITGVNGIRTLLNNHVISASNNTATIENWRIVITLINHDFNQNDNTGKEVSGTIIISKDDNISLCELNPGDCLLLDVVNQPTTLGKSVVFTGNNMNATWNNKLNQLEVSSIGESSNGEITYEEYEETTPLNSYIMSLNNTIQGTGKLLYEIGYIPDFENASAVTSYGTTPVYFANGSETSIAQSTVNSYWTFDNSTGTFTSKPSLMNVYGSMYYHVYAKVPESGYYQLCYTIKQGSYYNYLYLAKNTNVLGSIAASTSGDISGCISLDYLDSNDYINISERAYNKTSSPQMTFRLEKSTNGTTVDVGYRYEGTNPNNYIMFNNELWRIIGIFDENNHGVTNKQLVKIIRNDSIGAKYMNSNSKADWSLSNLYHLLNEQYYDWNTNKNNISNNCYNYSIESNVCDFSIIGIQDKYRNMITSVVWYLGGKGKTNYTSNKPVDVYTYERDPNSVKTSYNASVNGYIGLMYYSDFQYSVLLSECINRDSKGITCAEKNWLFGQGDEWIITHNSGTGISTGYAIYKTNSGSTQNASTSSSNYAVRPVLYLSENVYYISGTGSITDPYIIGM